MDWTRLLRDDPALLVPERHAEALTRAAAKALRDSAPATALVLMRRRVRVDPPPAAAERALLALAALGADARAEAEEALQEALDADPLDPAAGLVALRLASGPEASIAAARRLLASPVAGDEALAQALHALFSAGEQAATRLDLADGRLTGWAVWRGASAPLLALHGPAGESRHALAAEAGLAFAPIGAAGARIDLAAAGPLAGWRLEREERILALGSLHARSRHRAGSPAPPGAGPPATVPPRRPVRVVMPVYGDPEATRDALRAAVLEVARHPGARLVVVDDCSRLPAIAAMVAALGARGLLEVRRTPVNLGFPGAVALGLDGLEGEDALVLNADAILPPGALARLAEAAYGAPDIGTATPLSNNGEWTSWPRLGQATPAPAPPEAARLDAAARRLDLAPVDLPNGIGFALFVRHDCLAAIGAPSAVYERGYFEDLEWTLEARRAGFRNVAVPALFVPHHGSRSFGADKALLVARNLRRLRRRYPGVRAASAAFRAADPLRAARARLEEACPPAGRPPLLLGPAGSPALAERLHRLGEAGAGAVVLRWRRVGAALRVELAAHGGGAPQSLGFDPDAEGGAMEAWLAALAPARIEVAGSPPPGAILAAVRRLEAPVTILAGDPAPEAPEPLAAAFAAWRAALGERWAAVLAQDALTLAALRRHLGDDPDAARILAAPAAEQSPVSPPGPGRERRVACVMGLPLPASLAFAKALAAALARRDPAIRLDVLGASAGDLALLGRGIGATGPLAPGDFARAAAGARALVLPPADPSLALFQRLRDETGLPGAQADWSHGAAEPQPSSLLLPRHRDERDTLHALVDWLAGRLAP